MLMGDTDFTLDGPDGALITPPNYGTDELLCHEGSPSQICSYDISWNERNGNLDFISISLEANTFEMGVFVNAPPHEPFGLTGGIIVTDTQIDNCPALDTCNLTGFWQSDLPEPMSASLLVSGLAIFAAAGLAFRRRPLRHPS